MIKQDANEAITITFGECMENHVEMEQIGHKMSKGLPPEELENAKMLFEKEGCACEMYNLHAALEKEGIKNYEEAKVLVVKNAVEFLTGRSAEDMFHEQKRYEWDSTMYSRKHNGVVNKIARHNVCYADFSQTPDIFNKKGTVVAFGDVPMINNIRQLLPKYFGEKAHNLLAEGNKYYNVKKCGIGYHGDTERAVVIAVRLGAPIPLHYQWYKNSLPVGDNMRFDIAPGDMYVMSNKAVGVDWKKKSIYTLRHAAGCEKYTKVSIKR